MLGLPGSEVHRRVVRSLVLVPYSSVRLKTDVSPSVLSYISERTEQFPGVTVDETYLRDYPSGSIGAQMLGTVGEISPEEKKEARFRGVKAGHDHRQERPRARLRPLPARRRRQAAHPGRRVRPPGAQPAPEARPSRSPASACACRSTSAWSARTQEALAGIGGGRPGAAIAMDPRDGAILAMASHPTFDPRC